MNRSAPVASLSALTLALSALGQPTKPLCTTWQTPQDVVYTDDFVPMIHTVWRADRDPWFECLDTGTLAGKYTAYQLSDATWIADQGSNALISLRSIGHEYGDNEDCGWPTLPTEDDRAFFREADKLAGYELVGNPDFAHSHPFLTNATTVGPLRSWMIAYRDSLAYWIDFLDLDVDPNTFEFGFDMETKVTPENGETIKMLAFLAASDKWDTWKVPGSNGWEPQADHENNTTGETLEEMYDAMVAATEGSSDEWPESIFDETRGIKPDYDHEHANNRRYFLWFVSICERAREAVMLASAYEVLHATWPDAKCSNYNAANYDDLTAPTPTPRPTSTWFADKSEWASVPNPALAASWNPANTPHHYTQDMPGAYMSPAQSAWLFEPASLSDRWIGYRRRSLGQIDAPELYQLNAVQWAGDHTNGIHGHWSLNPYVPPEDQYPAQASYPLAGSTTTWGAWTPLLETKAQTRLAIERHAMESIINSGNSGNQARPGPWVSAFIQSGGIGSVYRSAERENRMVLGMLRAKKVPRIKFWFTHQEGTWTEQEQYYAFVDTRDLVDRTWATEVMSVQGIIGIDDSQPASSLEDTLRDEYGNDHMLSVLSMDDYPPQQQVAIEVVVKIPEDYQTGFEFEINLKVVAPAGAVGKLYAKSRLGARPFVLVPTMEGETQYSPDTSDEFEGLGSEARPVRRTFWLQHNLSGDAPELNIYHQFVQEPNGTYDYPHMVLRVYHDHVGDFESSSFDLVQVIPVQYVIGNLMDPKDALDIADLNADLCVDVADLQLFVNGFLDESAIADLDMDLDWDQDDIDLFFSAYSNE